MSPSSMALPISAPAPAPTIVPSVFDPPGAMMWPARAASDAAEDQAGGTVVTLAVVAVCERATIGEITRRSGDKTPLSRRL
jgi:hypothetical protein